MRRPWSLCALEVTSLLVLTTATARADDVAVTSIWYRGQEGCPDAVEFLARVEARGIRGRIAQVGDPIDFVVTIGKGPEQSRGLLERQTKSGVVAVRLLEGASCAEIADGMALSLALAITPASAPSPGSAAPVASPAAVKEPVPKQETAIAPRTAAPEAPQRSPRPSNFWTVGAQGTATFGIGPGALFGGAAFLGFTPGPVRPWAPSFRLAGIAGFGDGGANGHDYDLALFGARLEASVWLGWPSFHVNPVGALDVGALVATGHSENGRNDTGAWFALRLGLRPELLVSDSIALEAQVEAVVPFTRYHVRSADPPLETLYSTAPIGLGLGAGASFRLP